MMLLHRHITTELLLLIMILLILWVFIGELQMGIPVFGFNPGLIIMVLLRGRHYMIQFVLKKFCAYLIKIKLWQGF